MPSLLIESTDSMIICIVHVYIVVIFEGFNFHGELSWPAYFFIGFSRDVQDYQMSWSPNPNPNPISIPTP